MLLAYPAGTPDCGPRATRCRSPGLKSWPVGFNPFRGNHRRQLSRSIAAQLDSTRRNRAPAFARARQRRRVWLRASPSARAGNHLRASPAAQGKPQSPPVGGVSPSFCCHSFHLIHPLFLAAPTFRLVELAGCGNGFLSCFLSGPGRLPTGFRRPKPPGGADQA